ncbi:MAG: hypothetical protein HYR62_02020 [Actinobacteria bacterium]|nr:hypothetical protein [Actinomycetota bacterium]MBI3687260.1 hypothetical protein [Actinomycetota bacterium]
MSAAGLFPEPARVEPEPVGRLSAGRRRTQRQRAEVEAGWHPLTRDRSRPELGTCGTCAHRVLVRWHRRTYPKCDQGIGVGRPLDEAPYASHGPATDVRTWWPACGSWVRRSP